MSWHHYQACAGIGLPIAETAVLHHIAFRLSEATDRADVRVSDICAHTGCADSTARKCLSVLVDGGHLVRIGGAGKTGRVAVFTLSLPLLTEARAVLARSKGRRRGRANPPGAGGLQAYGNPPAEASNPPAESANPPGAGALDVHNVHLREGDDAIAGARRLPKAKAKGNRKDPHPPPETRATVPRPDPPTGGRERSAREKGSPSATVHVHPMRLLVEAQQKAAAEAEARRQEEARQRQAAQHSYQAALTRALASGIPPDPGEDTVAWIARVAP